MVAAPATGEPGFTVQGHLSRRDAALHELGQVDALVVFQGPHGYISPGWYSDQSSVPTWDYTTVHVSGRPTLLPDNAAGDVLHRTVAMLERRRLTPWRMDEETTEMLALLPGIVAFDMTPGAVQAKAKLGQQRSDQLTQEVLAGLGQDPAYRNEALAEAIRASRRAGTNS
jgi:transcriptional regulator